MKRANEAQSPAESKKIRLDDTSTEPNMLDILAQTVAKHQLVLTCNLQSTNGVFTAQYSAKSRMFKKSKKFPSEEAARNDAAALVIQALDPSHASAASRKKPPKKLMGDELILRFKETLGVDFGFSSRRNYNGNTILFCIINGVEFGHTSGWGGSETLLQLANGLLNSPTADKEITAMKENDTAAKAERDLIEEEGIKKLFEKLTNAFSTDKLKPGWNAFLTKFMAGKCALPLSPVECSVLVALCFIQNDAKLLEHVLAAVSKDLTWELNLVRSVKMHKELSRLKPGLSFRVSSDPISYARNLVTDLLDDDFMGLSPLSISLLDNQTVGIPFLFALVDLLLPCILEQDFLDFATHNIANVAAAIGHLDAFKQMEKVYMDFDEPGDLFDPLPLVSAFGNALDYSQLDVAREIVRIHENSDACFWDMRVSQENWYEEWKFLIEPRSGLLLHAVQKGHPELVKRIYKMNKRGMAEVVVATCRMGCYLNWESNDVVAELLEKDFLKKFNKDAGFSGRETVIALMGMVEKPSKSVFFRNVQLYAAAFGFLDVLTAARSKNLGSPVSILAVGLAAEYGCIEPIDWILKNTSVRLTDSAENAVKNLRVDYDAKDLWNKDACEMSSDDEDSLKKKKPNSSNPFSRANMWNSKTWYACPVSRAILNGHLMVAQSLLDKGSVFEPDDWKAGEAGRSAICDIKKVNSQANSFLKKLLTSAK